MANHLFRFKTDLLTVNDIHIIISYYTLKFKWHKTFSLKESRQAALLLIFPAGNPQ